jgi:hypothetical protein
LDPQEEEMALLARIHVPSAASAQQAAAQTTATIELGKTLAGVIFGVLLMLGAFYFWATGNEEVAGPIWSVALVVISGTIGIAIGAKRGAEETAGRIAQIGNT